MTAAWLNTRGLDAKYPSIIDRARDVVERTVAGNARVVVAPHKHDGGVTVRCYWSRWVAALPQHGPGRKHLRLIALRAWQEAIVDEHPWPFLAGLLHSDGCRCMNRFRTKLPSDRVAEYAYPRWFFSNESADIRRIFCRTCDMLGVRWTQSNRRNISVAHRASVELLDTYVGVKR